MSDCQEGAGVWYGVTANGYGASFHVTKVSKMDWGGRCSTVDILRAIGLYALNGSIVGF
jgi:hypothetical protein